MSHGIAYLTTEHSVHFRIYPEVTAEKFGKLRFFELDIEKHYSFRLSSLNDFGD